MGRDCASAERLNYSSESNLLNPVSNVIETHEHGGEFKEPYLTPFTV